VPAELVVPAIVAENIENIQSENKKENRKKALYDTRWRFMDRTENPIKPQRIAAAKLMGIIYLTLAGFRTMVLQRPD